MTAPGKSFDHLLGEYLEDSLDEADRAAFESRLKRDSAALDELCSHALLCSLLQRHALANSHLDLTEIPPRRKPHPLRRWTLALSTAAAIALIAGLAIHSGASKTSPQTAAIQSSQHSHFSLSGDGSETSTTTLSTGQSLTIAQGTVRLTLPDGSHCHAEAPAKLTMRTPNHLLLSGGVARFDVPKGAEGFKVTTQNLEIEDLGTAFGIDDRQSGQPQVHVLTGKVRATSLTGSRESIILNAGQAATLGPNGNLRLIPSDDVRFQPSLPAGLAALHLSFDPAADGKLHATGLLASRDRVLISQPNTSSTSPKIVAGHRGSALHFSHPSQSLTTTWPGIAGTLPRTLSFWLKIEPGNQDTGHILSWGLPGGPERMSAFSLIYSGSERANLRIVSGRRWLQSTSRLDDGQWHHLAVQLDSYTPGSWPHVKFFLDGKQEPLTPREDLDGKIAPLDTFSTVTDHPRSRPLTLGAPSWNSSLGAIIGIIDELTLVSGILTESQIQALRTGDLTAAGLAPATDSTHPKQPIKTNPKNP